MNRRKFLINGTTLSASSLLVPHGIRSFLLPERIGETTRTSRFSHRLPASDVHYKATSGYVEDEPVKSYAWASDAAYEAFMDMKFGIRLHWGVYAINHLEASWPFLGMSLEERQAYQELYQSWDPSGFDAQEWVDFFADSGAKMFSFTTKHHDGFCMFDTRTKVTKRTNWLAPGGPVIEDCNLHYSIMDTPFKRDVVGELCTAAHQKGLKIDLYFSHPDWYDADFRPYNSHPLQVPDAAKLAVLGKDRRPETAHPEKTFGASGLVIMPNPTKTEMDRMMKRHRDQLEEILTKYGKIDMVCLDQWLGPAVWPMLRDTIMHLRKICPDVMFRARGIGNYGDYYTPERFVPEDKENADVPWFVIYPLGKIFAYDTNESNYKGAQWIVRNLIDAVAKGGGFMAAIGPDGNGKFHPTAITQLRRTGAWLRTNGEGIYATRPREGNLWKEGDHIRFTRTKDNQTIFAFTFQWPGESLLLESVRPQENAKIRLLGMDQPLVWHYDNTKGLVIQTPAELKNRLEPSTGLGYGFRIPVG